MRAAVYNGASEQPLRRHRRLMVSREREGKQDNNSLSLTIMLPHLPIVSPPRCIIVTRTAAAVNRAQSHTHIQECVCGLHNLLPGRTRVKNGPRTAARTLTFAAIRRSGLERGECLCVCASPAVVNSEIPLGQKVNSPHTYTHAQRAGKAPLAKIIIP